MDKLLAVVQYILNMGPTVILPITIVVLGMIFRIKFTKALKSGLTIGIGFVGINLVVNLLTSTLGPAAQGMVERFGLNLTVIDVGWPHSISNMGFTSCTNINTSLFISKLTIIILQ